LSSCHSAAKRTSAAMTLRLQKGGTLPQQAGPTTSLPWKCVAHPIHAPPRSSGSRGTAATPARHSHACSPQAAWGHFLKGATAGRCRGSQPRSPPSHVSEVLQRKMSMWSHSRKSAADLEWAQTRHPAAVIGISPLSSSQLILHPLTFTCSNTRADAERLSCWVAERRRWRQSIHSYCTQTLEPGQVLPGNFFPLFQSSLSCWSTKFSR